MDLRRVSGYVALGLLALYLLWALSRTAPQLRKGNRDRRVRTQLMLIRVAAVALAALFVATVHFWATAWWQVALAVPVALVVAMLLRRAHRRLTGPPRHRAPLAQRVRRTGHFQIIREAGDPAPHRHAAGDTPTGTVPFVVPGADTAAPPAPADPRPSAAPGDATPGGPDDPDLPSTR
ncbi:hypothetical protein [Pseudonocardia parietis]|uniref:Uncharacterized protein n=1 Tax=Pseudonocardia parietis TaxID=570936 RepID=A0ABS4VSZ5_9PSEU|nr:hypothetical protein [Pseudonocardia parietis]MBP2367052.1 hypothetical protein [Pseudonocardia parietis]